MHPVAERLAAKHVAPADLREIERRLANVAPDDVHLAAWMIGKSSIAEVPNPFPAGTADAVTWEATLAKSRQHQNVTKPTRIWPKSSGFMVRRPL